MNGLQSLTQWENDFNNPTGSMLGLLNAIQVRQLFTRCSETTILRSLRISVPWAVTHSLRICLMALDAVLLFSWELS